LNRCNWGPQKVAKNAKPEQPTSRRKAENGTSRKDAKTRRPKSENLNLELERIHQCCSAALRVLEASGLFGFWLRFSSMTGFLNLRRR